MKPAIQFIVGFGVLLLVSPVARADKAKSQLPEQPTFETHIRPLFKAHCFECHGETEKPKAGLDLRLQRLMVQGGKTGPALVVGKPDESSVFTRVKEHEMPPGKVKLKPEEMELLRRWIATGAKTEKPEPAIVGTGILISDDDRQWWSFQPIQRPALPKVNADSTINIRNPIDAFLLAKLNAQGFNYNSIADKHTLIRRVTFDLTGLPPTTGAIAQFVNDHSPDAYEKLVERLLASPHYGERWGRHWLDVAGYADSEGYDQTDALRTNAWKYRDYVIRSLNTDKPFDQFIREQIAGDELVPRPYTNLKADDIDKLTATGFLRMAPDGTAVAPAGEQKLARNQVIADTLKVVSSSLLGLTVNCAQCHNHRYDPIPQTDYYRLRAIFEPSFDLTAWKVPNARQISLYTDADRKAAAEFEEQAKKIDAERLKKQEAFIAATLEKQFEKVPEAVREQARVAKKTPVAKLTAEQKKLLAEYPNLNVNPGSLYLYDSKAAAELKKMTEEATAIRNKKPKEEFVRVLTEEPNKVPPTMLFHRGDPDQPKQAIMPGALVILDEQHALRIDKPNGPTTGRKLAFAQWLTDAKNPLTARVLANRVWLHHFGRGIVGSPADFGRLGEKPTHPELLDWLAAEFMQPTFKTPTESTLTPWSLKHLHRLMVTSNAYRQSSVRERAKDAADPDNRLYGRYSLRRLEAEAVRDAVLFATGKLNPKMYGPPVSVMEDDTGMVVIGKPNRDGAGYKLGDEKVDDGEEFRRSVYVQVRRSKPLAVLDAFDWAVVEPNCEVRNSSTAAPQSLLLLNNEFILQQSRLLAERVKRDAGSDLAKQVETVWTLAYGTSPTSAELQKALAFLKQQTKALEAAPKPVEGKNASAATKVPPKKGPAPPAPQATPADQALALLCQAVLVSNRFLYVD